MIFEAFMFEVFIIMLLIFALAIFGGIIALLVVSIVLLCKKKIKGFVISFCALIISVYCVSYVLYNANWAGGPLADTGGPYRNTRVQITEITDDSFILKGDKYVSLSIYELYTPYSQNGKAVANHGTRPFWDIVFFKNETYTLYEYTIPSGHNVVEFHSTYYCKEADKAAILDYQPS